MSKANLIALAEACSRVRGSIGRMLLAADGSPEQIDAGNVYRSSLEDLLRVVREEQCGLYLEIAGEFASKRTAGD